MGIKSLSSSFSPEIGSVISRVRNEVIEILPGRIILWTHSAVTTRPLGIEGAKRWGEPWTEDITRDCFSEHCLGDWTHVPILTWESKLAIQFIPRLRYLWLRLQLSMLQFLSKIQVEFLESHLGDGIDGSEFNSNKIFEFQWLSTDWATSCCILMMRTRVPFQLTGFSSLTLLASGVFEATLNVN